MLWHVLAGKPFVTCMIQVRDLHKSFGANHVLRGVELEVEKGTTTVILGRSGGGKSVLMKHLIGLMRPDSGCVEVDGRDLGTLSRREQLALRTQFGLVFQMAALFDSMTVYENVAFPLYERRRDLKRQARDEQVMKMLGLLGLESAAHRLPAELSGGMRKRVGLARALVLEPKVVLYDEPTTGLDPITTASVDRMINDAKTELGVTSVVISHDIASAFTVADQVVFLHEGKIVERGNARKLRSSEHPAVREFLGNWFEARPE